MCSRGPRGTKMAEGAATVTEKTVLVCLGERKRAVTFRSGGGNEVESLLESVKEVYKDVLGDKCEQLLLQSKSEKWQGEFIDIQSGPVDDQCVLKASVVIPVQTSTEELSRKVKSICGSIGKPDEAHASALRKLFPASTSVPRKRSTAFDPTQDCVFVSEKKKKKAARCKPTQIAIVVIKDKERGVPRGNYKQQLLREQRIVKTEIYRAMNSDQVKSAILKAITHLNVAEFIVLECVNGQKLVEAENDSPDGNAVVESISRRKGGTFYILEVVSSRQAPGYQSTVASSSYKAAGNQSAVTSNNDKSDDCSDSDGLPAVNVSGQSAQQSAELAEFRRIREEQDREFQQSLQADREKVASAARERERQDLIHRCHESLRQKFAAHPPSSENMLRIALRLPNGDKVQHCFLPNQPTKVLYEFAFCQSNPPINTGFQLFRAIPRVHVPMSDTTTVLEGGLCSSDMLVVECNEEEEIESQLHQFGDSETIASGPCEVAKCPLTREIRVKAEAERCDFMHSLETHDATPHQIHRSNIYEEVITLFSESQIMYEYPLRISFVGEQAVDTGGVLRDMLSAFWEEAYLKHFDGAGLLTPIVHAQIDLSALPILGSVLSHGYLLTGYIPLRIAFPTLAGMLLGPCTLYQNEHLMAAFIDSISSTEAAMLKECLKVKGSSFSVQTQAKLVDIFSRFDSRQLPTPANLKQQLLQVAKYQFIIKPMAAITSINSGIPPVEGNFWKGKTVDDLYTLYQALTADPSKVLELLTTDPEDELNSSEQRVYLYLQQFVGNMRSDELQNFLRFVTGCSVCPSNNIKVIFNTLSGLARRPISHTCDNTLELSSVYINYQDLASEFQEVLSKVNSEFVWQMDCI